MNDAPASRVTVLESSGTTGDSGIMLNTTAKSANTGRVTAACDFQVFRDGFIRNARAPRRHLRQCEGRRSFVAFPRFQRDVGRAVVVRQPDQYHLCQMDGLIGLPRLPLLGHTLAHARARQRQRRRRPRRPFRRPAAST